MKTAPVLLIAPIALWCFAPPASAQDPVKLSPNMYTVLLENEHVRVLEFRQKAGEKEPMHSHPSGVAYLFTGSSRVRFTTPDGKAEVLEPSKPGTAVWIDPVTHTWENLGPDDVRVLIVEMKDLPAAKKASAK